jgi:hypothetical protein
MQQKSKRCRMGAVRLHQVTDLVGLSDHLDRKCEYWVFMPVGLMLDPVPLSYHVRSINSIPAHQHTAVPDSIGVVVVRNGVEFAV